MEERVRDMLRRYKDLPPPQPGYDERFAEKPLKPFRSKAERTRTRQGWFLILLNALVALRVFEVV